MPRAPSPSPSSSGPANGHHRPPDVDLNLVAIFAKVVELGSFTAAGGVLGLPKSSVSRSVARLEETLGVRLLQRTTRKLGLTQAGERYLGEVRGPLTRLSEATSEIFESTQQPRGLVRVSISAEPGEGLVSAVLAEFVRRNPGIRIDLVVTNRRVNLVEEGIDLALRAGPLDDSSLIARRLANVGLGLFASPDYLARKGTPRRLVDLTTHDCILHRSAVGLHPWRLQGPRGAEQVTVSGPVVADDLGSVRHLVVAGAGVALIPDVVLQADLEKGKLVRVLPDYGLRGPGLFLVSPPLRHVPARVTLLREFLLQEIPARLSGTPCALDPAGARAAVARPTRRIKAAARR